MVGVLAVWAVVGQFRPWEAVSALFTGLAFAGVIVTMRLQSDELRLQRAELKLTREELRGQKEQLRAQDQTMQRQTFEGTYFQLLRSFRDLADTLTDITIRDHVGNAFWFYIRRSVFTQVKAQTDITSQVNEFEKQLNTHPSLAPYFSYLNEILLFLEKSTFGTDPLYARLLRAQLRSDELIFVAFFGLTVVGSRAFKGRLEKFGILKFLPTDPSSPTQLVVTAYDPRAMQDPEGA